MIECLMCGKKVLQVNYRHLESCSHISMEEYRNRFPDTPLMDNLIKKKCGHVGIENGMFGKKRTKKWKKKLSNTIKNKMNTPEMKEKIGAFKRGRTYEEMYGKRKAKEIKQERSATIKNRTYKKYTHSSKVKKKMSVAQKKRDNSTRFKIPATSLIIKKREDKKKKNWLGLSIEERHSKLKNFLNAGGKKKSKTSIEESVNIILISLNLIENKDYTRNTQIDGYNVDFLVNNIFIIECYGDYWHGNPKFFNDLPAQLKREKDLIRQKYLKDKGYKFIYFWGVDIKKSKEKIVLRIRRFLKTLIAIKG